MNPPGAESESRGSSRLPRRHALPCAILAAVAFNVAFMAPRGAAAVFVALPCLFALAHLRTGRQAFYAGMIVGVAMYGPQLAFFHSVFGLPGTVLWLVLALPIALFLLLVHHAHRRLRPTWACLITPILWTGIEYFRSELHHLRFAWLLPGQAGAFLPGRWMLRAGVYGVGFGFALVAALVISRNARLRLVGAGASLLLAILMYVPIRSAPTANGPLRVAGVQLEYPSEPKAVGALDHLAELHPEAQLLVLSEYTFQGPVPESIRSVVRKHQRYLIVGGIKPLDDTRFYDTAFVIGPDGNDVFEQGKSIPVQFMNDGLPAAARHVWDSPWGKIGIAVCYDVSYARVIDDFIRQGAQGLIFPTMDLESWGGYERRMLHGRMGPTRAAEYRIPVFSVWSSGESQLIDRQGQLIAKAGYPGQGDIIAGPFDLGAPGHMPPDRWLAITAVCASSAFTLFLIFGKQRTPNTLT